MPSEDALSEQISYDFFRKLPSKRRPRLFERDFQDLLEWLNGLRDQNQVATEDDLWDRYKIKIATLRKYCKKYRDDLIVRQRTYPHKASATKGMVYFDVIPRAS